MKKKIEQHIKQNFPFLIEKKLLIACSGGIDSIVLTMLLRELGYNISLIHCNFSLRGKESDGDQEFVENLADKLSIAVFTETFDTKTYAKDHKLSTQMAARELRYTWFSEVLNNFKFDYLLTGHHADDDMETFFINLTRGTGLRGLTGIPSVNEKTVRPLLKFSRTEILNYAKKENLYWREDSSNAKTDYLRNKLRLEVIPKFKAVSKKPLQNFQKTQQHLIGSQNLIDDYMALVYNIAVSENFDGYSIHIEKLKELPHTEALLYELLQSFGFTAWEDISDLLTAQTGKQILSYTHRLLKNREVLLLTQLSSDEKTEEIIIFENETEVFSPLHLVIEMVENIGKPEKNCIYIDRKKVSFPLKLRKWEEGDVFQPFGMKGKKKVSKFFKDEKLSLVAKEKTWILCSDNLVIWIVGMRSDDRFKVTENTKEILKIALK